jgi:hypothetical protein
MRLTTRSGIFQKPLAVERAPDVVDAWLQQPAVIVVELLSATCVLCVTWSCRLGPEGISCLTPI